MLKHHVKKQTAKEQEQKQEQSRDRNEYSLKMEIYLLFDEAECFVVFELIPALLVPLMQLVSEEIRIVK